MEEALSEMMKRTPLDSKDKFSSVQWDKSKDEFWGIVKKMLREIARHSLTLVVGMIRIT